MAKNFKQQMKKAEKEIELAIEKTVRATSLEMMGEIVRKTPVGNPSIWKSPPTDGYRGGSLRGNWQAQVASPNVRKLDVEDSSGSPTIRAGAAKISKFQLKDESIWLSNNLPYADRVEKGYSKQAPQGMVRTTIAQFKRILNKFAKVNNK